MQKRFLDICVQLNDVQRMVYAQRKFNQYDLLRIQLREQRLIEKRKQKKTEKKVNQTSREASDKEIDSEDEIIEKGKMPRREETIDFDKIDFKMCVTQKAGNYDVVHAIRL